MKTLMALTVFAVSLNLWAEDVPYPQSFGHEILADTDNGNLVVAVRGEDKADPLWVASYDLKTKKRIWSQDFVAMKPGAGNTLVNSKMGYLICGQGETNVYGAKFELLEKKTGKILAAKTLGIYDVDPKSPKGSELRVGGITSIDKRIWVAATYTYKIKEKAFTQGVLFELIKGEGRNLPVSQVFRFTKYKNSKFLDITSVKAKGGESLVVVGARDKSIPLIVSLDITPGEKAKNKLKVDWEEDQFKTGPGCFDQVAVSGMGTDDPRVVVSGTYNYRKLVRSYSPNGTIHWKRSLTQNRGSLLKGRGGWKKTKVLQDGRVLVAGYWRKDEVKRSPLEFNHIFNGTIVEFSKSGKEKMWPKIAPSTFAFKKRDLGAYSGPATDYYGGGELNQATLVDNKPVGVGFTEPDRQLWLLWD